MRGLLWVFREIYSAVEGESEGEKERLTDELSRLYMQLETGQISEAEFDEQEKTVLDRLDELEARRHAASRAGEGIESEEEGADEEPEEEEGVEDEEEDDTEANDDEDEGDGERGEPPGGERGPGRDA